MEKKNIIELEVKIEKDEFEKALDKAFNKKVQEVKVDGFRKGKVPKDLFIKKFGKESLYMDAVDILLPEAYEKALNNKDVEPIIEPKVDLKEIDENGCTFLFTITTRPEVNIKKYKGLNVKKEEVKVTKEEISAEVENMLKKYSEMTVKENGSVVEGNVAIIDFEGFNDGKAFDGGKAENYSLEIGSHTFIPGFEEQVIGMNKDEEKEIKVTFPEEYPSEELKGKEVTFKVKVNEIKEKLQRELNEEFFADLAMEGVSSKETLEKSIEESIKASKDMDAENKFVDAVLKKIGENTEIDIPEELIEHELDHMVEHFEEQLRMQGISKEVFFEMTKSDDKALREQMKEEAVNHVKYRFILEEIQKLEKINVTDEEANKEVEKYAKQYNMNSEEFLKAVGGLESIKYEVLMQKTIDFLKENN